MLQLEGEVAFLAVSQTRTSGACRSVCNGSLKTACDENDFYERCLQHIVVTGNESMRKVKKLAGNTVISILEPKFSLGDIKICHWFSRTKSNASIERTGNLESHGNRSEINHRPRTTDYRAATK